MLKQLAWIFFVLIVIQAAAEDRLLTKNGMGSYFAVPNMGNDRNPEKSSFFSPVPFSRGMLAGGKKSSMQWSVSEGFIFLLFDKPYHISRIKIKLKSGEYAGTQMIFVSTWQDIRNAILENPLENGVEKTELDFLPPFIKSKFAVKAINGLNEIKIDELSSVLMLKFERFYDKRLIDIESLEVWGDNPEESPAVAECRDFDKFLKMSRNKEVIMRDRLAGSLNITYPAKSLNFWATLLPWPGTTNHQTDCVFSQKDGDISEAAACFGKSNYWAASSPASQAAAENVPQVLTITFLKPEKFNVNRFVWCSTNARCSDYSLEYFADGKWTLLYHDRANSSQIATYSFSPVVTDKLRLTMYNFTGDLERLLMRSFQIYNLEGDK